MSRSCLHCQADMRTDKTVLMFLQLQTCLIFSCLIPHVLNPTSFSLLSSKTLTACRCNLWLFLCGKFSIFSLNNRPGWVWDRRQIFWSEINNRTAGSNECCVVHGEGFVCEIYILPLWARASFISLKLLGNWGFPCWCIIALTVQGLQGDSTGN